jgi:hypothetical protein
MATILKHTRECGYAWCGCCGDLNPSSGGKYLRTLRRRVKRSERQTWQREARDR